MMRRSSSRLEQIRQHFSSMQTAFNAMDKNRNARISKEEFVAAVDKANILRGADLDAVFAELDLDGSGALSYSELVRRFSHQQLRQSTVRMPDERAQTAEEAAKEEPTQAQSDQPEDAVSGEKQGTAIATTAALAPADLSSAPMTADANVADEVTRKPGGS